MFVKSLAAIFILLPLSALRAVPFQEALEELHARMRQQALSVEASVTMEDGATTLVRGIIDASDSDLFVQPTGGEGERVIIWHRRAWGSKDAGRTWTAKPWPDRTFEHMAQWPIGWTPWDTRSLEKVEHEVESGEMLQQVTLKLPKRPAGEDWMKYWLAYSGGKPSFIRRAERGLRVEKGTVLVKARYSAVENSPAVKPPAGVEDPEKPVAPEIHLAIAKERMAQKSGWRVGASVHAKVEMQIAGVLFGPDYDLLVRNKGDQGGYRQIVIGNTQYASVDGGKTWGKGEAPAQRHLYDLVTSPIRFDANEEIPPFEVVGESYFKGGASVRIRLRPPRGASSEPDRMQYTISMRNGEEPMDISSYEGELVYHGLKVTGAVRYEPMYLDESKSPIVAPH